MIEYTLINTQNELNRKCESMKNEKQLGVDLEADSMYHYKEKVCLVQIADSSSPFLVDPLAPVSLEPMRPVFEDPGITKVFHGADFDIRSLDRDFNILVNNLFDTEIACRFLGIHKRGLAALLHKYFNLDVDKRFQKIDWSKRPLSKEMIGYSITDVLHLVKLSEILTDQLKKKGRLAWAEEEFAIQAGVRFENNGTEPLFLKFKGAGKMSRKNLAVLESLLHLREKIAIEKDRPLFKVMSASAISRLAEEKPDSISGLKNSGALSGRQIGMYGEACLTAISRGLEMKDRDLPAYPRKRAAEPDPGVSERIKALKEMRTLVSRKTGLEPGFLINNALIAAIAADPPRSFEDLEKMKNIRQWQIDVLSDPIFKTLNQCR